MSDFPEQAYVRQFLIEHFSLAELQDLAFDLSVDYEDLPHATKSEFCRELLAFFERRDNLGCLLIEVIKLRYDATISQLLTCFQGCTPRRKVQIILPGDKLVNKPDLLGALAQLLGVRTDEVQLIATAPGSIKLLIGVPGNVADWLLKAEVVAFLTEYGYRVLTVNLFESLPITAQLAWKQTILKLWSAPVGQLQFGLTPHPTQVSYPPVNARPSANRPVPIYQPELSPTSSTYKPSSAPLPGSLPLASLPKRRGSGVIVLFGTFLALVLVVGVGIIAFLASQSGDYTPTTVVAVSPTPISVTTIAATTLTTVTTAPVLPIGTGLPTRTSTPTITPTPTTPPISAIFVSPKNQSQLSAETAVQLEVRGPVDHLNLIADLPGDPTHNIAAQILTLAILRSNSNWRFIWVTDKIPPQTGITLTAQACFGTDNTHCVGVTPVTNLTIAPPNAIFIKPTANMTGGYNSTLALAATVHGFANHITYTVQYFNPTLFIRNPPAPVTGKLTAAIQWADTVSLPEGSYNLSGEVCWSDDDTICYEVPKVASVAVSSKPEPPK